MWLQYAGAALHAVLALWHWLTLSHYACRWLCVCQKHRTSVQVMLRNWTCFLPHVHCWVDTIKQLRCSAWALF